MFNLSGEPGKRLGVWLFISLAAHIPCLPSRGGREGEKGTCHGAGGGENGRRWKRRFWRHPNVNPTRGISTPSPRQKPDSATLPVILFVDPVLLAWKGKISQEAEPSVPIHTASPLMTKPKGRNPMNRLLHWEPRMLLFTFGKWEPAWKNTEALGPGGSVPRSYLELLARCAYLAAPPAVHSRDGFLRPSCYQTPVLCHPLTQFPHRCLGPLWGLRQLLPWQPHTKSSSKSQDYVFSALRAHAVRISSVNNRPFSHGLFRISDETAEMSMRGGRHQSERGSMTPLFFSLTAIIFKGGRKPPCLLLYLFYDLGCC